MTNTPRPHLSYSQLSCLERSQEDYIKRYIWDGKPNENNVFLNLGKRLAVSLENRETLEDDWIEAIKSKLPDYPKREYEIKAELYGIPLIGILDGFNPRGRKLGEYKTGLNPNLKGWKDQMLFYSLIFYQSKKKLPKEIKVFWAKTQWNTDGQLVFTGSVREYEIKIGLKEVIKFVPRVISAWQKIQKLCDIERQKFGSLSFDKD